MSARANQTRDRNRSDFERALRHHRAEEFAAAEALYQKITEREPRNGAVLNLLGVVRCQRGDLAGGMTLLERSLAVEKTQGAYRNLGLALQIAGRLDEAVAAYRSACDLAPSDPQARLELGDVLRAAGRPAEALAELRAAVDIKPDLAEAHHALGGTLCDLGREVEAQAAYGVALDLQPNLAEAHLNLATLLHGRRRLEEAHDAYAAGLALKPDSPKAWAELGGLLQELARPEEARDACRRAYAREPDSFAARWYLATCHLRPLYRSEEEIDVARAGYGSDLRALARDCDLGSTEALRAAADALARRLPFYLTAQGRCDRDLQEIYGAMVCRVMQALYPRFAVRPPLPPLRAGERIRIGIASSFIARHSVWKIPVRGWVENLDAARFALHGYFLGAKADDITELARASSARFVNGPLPVERWAELIRADDLHVLIFPELGMDGTALQLAALRLAAVQATSLGHPETSGLPSIDYFLSSELMESDADSHYTERLVRLPNLAAYYLQTLTTEIALKRADIGLRADATVYWCCQALHKYLPQYDHVFPRIAARVRGAQFAFIRHANGAGVSRIFEQRLARAFADHGLSVAEHCVFLPPMDFQRFHAVARMSNVFLDSIGWSGFNSTLESLFFDIPPVVLPGALMRARHTAAVMTMMGVTETIAADVDGYIDIAVRLGNDPEWGRAVRSRIQLNKRKLFADTASLRALERFLIGAAERGVDGCQATSD